jgi:hypothetical protein
MLLKPANITNFVELEELLRSGSITFYFKDYKIYYESDMLPHESPYMVELIEYSEDDYLNNVETSAILESYKEFQIVKLVSLEDLVRHSLGNIRDSLSGRCDSSETELIIEELIEAIDQEEYL